MKTTFVYIGIIVTVFFLCFLESCLLGLSWFLEHWVREALVLIIILLTLFFGVLVFWQFAKKQSGQK